MDTNELFRLFFGVVAAGMLFLAWRRKDRAGVFDWSLLIAAGAALFIPETYPALRYGLAGAALVIVMVRSVKRDLIDGSDPHARMMTISLLVFAASLILVMWLPTPLQAWAKYVVIVAAVVMMAALLRPLVWMTRTLFSAHRLYRDLKHSRPPREADEKMLGVDLSVLRKPEPK